MVVLGSEGRTGEIMSIVHGFSLLLFQQFILFYELPQLHVKNQIF
jgi:hypothetical protein